MGIGLGTELGVQDAFGLLAMGSIGPICSVLIAVVIIHVFLPTKYSLFTPWLTQKMRKHLE